MGAIASFQLRRADRRMVKTLAFVRCAYVGNTTRLQELLDVHKMRVDAQDALVRAGASPSIVDNNGRNAVHHACRKDHDDVLKYLLDELKMDVNAPSESKDTPLHKAVIGKAVRCIEVLLQHGADPRLRNDQNRTPLEELDADPGVVKDVVPEPLATARMQEELDQWRRDFLTEVKHSSDASGLKGAVEQLLTPNSKRWGRRGSADTPATDSTTGLKYAPAASASTDCVRGVENTLVTSFRARISELSDRSSSNGDLSSRPSSAQLPTTGLWARRSVQPPSSSTTPSPGSGGRLGSARGVIVPLNLQNMNTPANGQVHSDTSHSMDGSDRSTGSSNSVNPRRRNLRYAGKRVIMSLRVKKILTGDEKRQMIRLILQRHMNPETPDAIRRIGGDNQREEEQSGNGPALTRTPSAFTLSVSNNI